MCLIDWIITLRILRQMKPLQCSSRLLVIVFALVLFVSKLDHVQSYKENCTADETKFYYHLHMPKAGGTSLRKNLIQFNKERHFGCFVSIEGRYSDFETLFPNKSVRIMTTFRSPTQHVISQYNHCKTSYAHKYGWHLMPSLEEWLQEHVDNNAGVSRNVSRFHCYQPYNMQFTLMEGHTPSEFFYVGVLDQPHIGHCLLYWQLYNTVLESCKCQSVKKMWVRHDTHGVQPFNTSSVTEREYELIRNLTRIDNLLYEAAVHEFFNRVRRFEKLTGVNLYCE